MFALLARYSDGYTFQADHPIAVFENEDIANLVAEALTRIAKGPDGSRRDFPDLQHGGFVVQPAATYKAESESESRVKDIVDEILRDSFPRH